MSCQNARDIACKYNQSHLFDYFNELSDSEKQILINDIERTDFSVLENLNGESKKPLGKITPADALSIEEVEENKAEFEELGLRAIRQGKVAAVLLAGGQGTRLGSNLPKGMFNIGVSRELTIFEQQMNNIFSVTNKAGAQFHLFIMTSSKNGEVTRKFFESKNYFGYDKDKIHFYVQKEAPACDEQGKVFLEEKYKIATSPNGNGGWYSSLVEAGYTKLLNDNGVEWLNVYSVDNVLQAICDPVFIGATIKSGCACSGKVVKKVSPEERVGVMCKEDGAPTIIEYYEMPKALASAKDADGQLTLRYGVTLNYLFSIKKLNEIYKQKLPYHLAKKAIPHIEGGKKVVPESPNGYKFETLAVDLIKMMGSCLAVEIERDKEFAPVKNKTGVDSVESARALLQKNGVKL
jgi:UDP-N-acetylglucosamine/UDP-N-acetylgalactosamine diphosphorylase